MKKRDRELVEQFCNGTPMEDLAYWYMLPRSQVEEIIREAIKSKK